MKRCDDEPRDFVIQGNDDNKTEHFPSFVVLHMIT